MGTAKQPEPVKLFLAVMHPAGFNAGPVMVELCDRFGGLEATAGPMPFTFTDYYEAEMGTGLLKTYHIFGAPINREMLASIKNATNEIESRLARNGHRSVNLDPGYLSRDKLVLASTKDFYHRIYIGDGIFAEVTLHYRKGIYRFFSWTYPDYKLPGVQEILEKARASLVGEIRKSGPANTP
jgi:hypothetical protein